MEECRICFDEDIPENFITPCLCRGTNKYVHENCLQNWRLMAENPENIIKCPSCKFKYLIEKKNNELCPYFKNYAKKIGINIKNIFMINISYLIILSLIIYLFNNFNIRIYEADNSINNSLDIKGYNIYVFHISNFIIFFIYLSSFIFDILTTLPLFYIFKSIKKFYFVSYLFCTIILTYISFISIIPGFISCTVFLYSLFNDYIDFIGSNEILKEYRIISLTNEEIVNHTLLNI